MLQFRLISKQIDLSIPNFTNYVFDQEIPIFSLVQNLNITQLEGDKYLTVLDQEIAKSMRDTSENRRRRLKSAPKTPEKIQTVMTAFKRNPDVIVEVLLRANGICERCKQEAPFLRRKDETPYLEVHHIVRLADGGVDSVENALALCPNCHRELHFGSVC